MLRKSLPPILFLALCVPPLSALDESLVGTWEASGEGDGFSFAARLVIQEDGTFEVSNVARTEDGYWRAPQVVFEEDDDLTVADAEFLTRLFREAWPETPLDTSSFLGSGTYSTAGDTLRLGWVVIDLTYDDRDYTGFMLPFWTRFWLNWEAELRAAQGFEFPEEDRLALEQELTTLYQGTFTTEALLVALNELPPTTYNLRDGGEVLVLEGSGLSDHAPLFFEEAEPGAIPKTKPLAYRRIDVASAVTPATWGGVKSTLAP